MFVPPARTEAIINNEPRTYRTGPRYACLYLCHTFDSFQMIHVCSRGALTNCFAYFAAYCLPLSAYCFLPTAYCLHPRPPQSPAFTTLTSPSKLEFTLSITPVLSARNTRRRPWGPAAPLSSMTTTATRTSC